MLPPMMAEGERKLMSIARENGSVRLHLDLLVAMMETTTITVIRIIRPDLPTGGALPRRSTHCVAVANGTYNKYALDSRILSA